MKKHLCIVTLIFFAFGCERRTENELWIIPEGYRGYLVIIPNRADGVTRRHEGSSLLYEFPREGILKTQFDLSYGTRAKTEFFMVSKNGVRTRLSEAWTSSDREKLEDGEWYVSRGYTAEDSRLPYGSFLWKYVDQKQSAVVAQPRPVEEFVLEFAIKSGDL